MKKIIFMALISILVYSPVFGLGQKLVDSVLISYSNIYADTMSNADSVRCRFTQGAKTDTFQLINVSTGLYSKVKKIDSAGLVRVDLDVFNWKNSVPKINLVLSDVVGDHLWIRNDSAIVSYSNIYADTMLDADSVRCRFTQGSETDTFTLVKITTGAYLGRKKLDSTGLVSAYIDVFNWKSSTPKRNLTFAASAFVKSGVVFTNLPTSLAKCDVTGTVFYKSAVGTPGLKVSIAMMYSTRYGMTPVYQFPETTSTDANGQWHKTLFKSDSLVPANKAIYLITIRDTSIITPIIDKKSFRVPDSSTWTLNLWR